MKISSCLFALVALTGLIACDDPPPPDTDGGAGSDAGSVDPPEGCEGGPLAAPIPNCQPTPPPSTGDHAQDCVNRINQFRAECQCLPPLERWTEGEACAREHAEYDSMGRPAHAGFNASICDPGGRAQNECPGWRSESMVIGGCLQLMWDEGPGEDFQAHGHYLNMSSTSHTRVACGVFETPGGELWAVQNFR